MKLYRLLLCLFPKPFRARFGDDMSDVFADRMRAARRRGWLAVIALWWRTAFDISAHASAERRHGPHAGPDLRGIMAAIIEDFTTAIRGHLRRPGLILLGAPMLAVGIGFNTALFAVVHEIVLRPLPYFEPGRVVMLWTGRNPDGSGSVDAYADFLEWKARSKSFESLATYNIGFGTLANGGDPEEIGGAVVSPEFFHVLRGHIELGRGIEPGDERMKVEEARPIVLSDDLWTRRFHRDPLIIGQTIRLSDHPRRVVGIVAPGFVHPEPFWGERAEFWSPLTVTEDMRTNHLNHFLRVIGRLAPGVTLDQARAEMDGIGRQLMNEFPTKVTQPVVLAPIASELEKDTRSLSWIFLGAAALVLTLGIANTVNLLLARANERREELAVRAALGATRSRLVTQLVADSTIVGLAGGLLGLGLARLGIQALVAFSPTDLAAGSGGPTLATAGVDAATAAFAFVLSIVTGTLCGILPAWRVGRARLTSTVGQRGSSGLETSRGRRWIVSAEIALALPLVVGAGLLTRTLIDMERVDPGFDVNHVLQFRISTSGQQYAKSEAVQEFFSRLLARLRAKPGITDAGIVSSLPLGGLNNTAADFVYEQTDGTPAQMGAGFRSVTAGYFSTLHIPIRQGRLFDSSAADAEGVVINDRAADAMWGRANPIGRRLRFGTLQDPPDKQHWLTVLGVVGSVRHERLISAPTPDIFEPYQADAWSTMTVVARTLGDPDAIGPAARAAVREVDPHLAIVNLAPVGTLIDGQLAAPRFGVMASTVFGALGLGLATFGLFAVLSLSVAQRTREIGIRMALGASKPAVGRLLARESVPMVGAGCVVGCLAAALIAKALEAQLYGVATYDEWAFAESLAVLLLAAAAAGFWPARRAMRVNPVTALRAD